MNDIERIHKKLLSFPESEVGEPFGPGVLVYKVAGKMVATLAPEEVPPQMNLKCEPQLAVGLRDEHDAILPGYHMNKQHWNTLILDGSLQDEFVLELIEHSFDCVVASMPKKDRERLQ